MLSTPDGDITKMEDFFQCGVIMWDFMTWFHRRSPFKLRLKYAQDKQMYNLLHFPSCRRCLPQLITMFRGDDSAKIKSALHSLNQKTNTVANHSVRCSCNQQLLALYVSF